MADRPPPGRRGHDAPYTDDERRQVAELHAAGHGRNEISRLTGIHGRKVSAIAKELGLTFVRGARIEAATAARHADAKAKRAALAVALLDDVERLRQQLFAACQAYNFGGKDNTFNMVELARPSFRDQQYMMTAIGIGIDRAIRLDEYDADPGIADAKNMLGALAAGLGAAYEQLKAEQGA